jgi:hypothetical protein
MKKIFLILLCLFVISCGTTGEAIKIGTDTFTVTASKHNITGGAPEAKTNALSTATNQCKSLNKELLVISATQIFERPFYNYSVTFKCVN